MHICKEVHNAIQQYSFDCEKEKPVTRNAKNKTVFVS